MTDVTERWSPTISMENQDLIATNLLERNFNRIFLSKLKIEFLNMNY